MNANRKSDLMVAALFLVSISAMAITYGTEINWIAHALIGLVSLAIVVEMDVSGALLARRLKGPKVQNPFALHKHPSVQLVLFMALSFSFGLWIRVQHGDPLLVTPHGWLGIALVLLAIAQWASCGLKRKKGVRLFHRSLGYALPGLVVAQSVLGMLMASSA